MLKFNNFNHLIICITLNVLWILFESILVLNLNIKIRKDMPWLSNNIWLMITFLFSFEITIHIIVWLTIVYLKVFVGEAFLQYFCRIATAHLNLYTLLPYQRNVSHLKEMISGLGIKHWIAYNWQIY